MTTAKLLGRLGWHGQCACCNGPRTKRQIRADEKRRWRRDALTLTQEDRSDGSR